MRKGETFIKGRSRDNAQALLNAAYRLNLAASVVRTTDTGYYVPEVVARELANAPGVTVVGEQIQYAELGYNELKTLAAGRGLSGSGTKPDLIERLRAAEGK